MNKWLHIRKTLVTLQVRSYQSCATAKLGLAIQHAHDAGHEGCHSLAHASLSNAKAILTIHKTKATSKFNGLNLFVAPTWVQMLASHKTVLNHFWIANARSINHNRICWHRPENCARSIEAGRQSRHARHVIIANLPGGQGFGTNAYGPAVFLSLFRSFFLSLHIFIPEGYWRFHGGFLFYPAP